MVVILAFYPLRHIGIGLDLWDTGYNYANFTYMGTEHMDSMWLFSTYLSNVLGNLFTKLPGGGTLLGMNFYTGLLVSLLALLGYGFCTRALKIPGGIVFLGEMAAVSLCWCPTALLYNYLTYVLFLAAVILLYYGLSKEKRGLLAAAGVCLGANVLVRFSNLPEAAMIVAVWGYDFICVRKERKERNGEGLRRGAFLRRTSAHTGWCLLGYMAALLALLGYIAARYGLDAYAAGISRLFAMTDNATDYKAASMLMGVIRTYVENLYWLVRFCCVAVGGGLAFALAGWARERLKRSWRILCVLFAGGALLALCLREFIYFRMAGFVRFTALFLVLALFMALAGLISRGAAKLASVLSGVALLLWLYHQKFCSFDFYSYDSILRPGVLFLIYAMLAAAIRVLDSKSTSGERLAGAMLILVILLTSLGSNNGVLPSMNNLFIAAPYALWESWRFLRRGKEIKIAGVTLSFFPVKTVLAAFLLMCAVQFGGFGIQFVFAEATGVQDTSAVVTNNEVLKNIKMSAEKAENMTQISAYVEENGLTGQEVILYGRVPALSFYLQMPSAFNPWSDLASYSSEAMARELAELENETPVIILGNSYALYEEGGEKALHIPEVSEKDRLEILADEKWPLLAEFMCERGYEQTFRNERFAVYRSGKTR